MGQVLRRLLETQLEQQQNASSTQSSSGGQFPDLTELPPELSLCILSNLNATDLCLASCVWDGLANDEILWQSLCKSSWMSVSIYHRIRHDVTFSYKRLFLLLDDCSVTFNFKPEQGIDVLIKNEILDDTPLEIAKFIHCTKRLKPEKRREFLHRRRDVLNELLHLQNFNNLFLPNALRKFFGEVSAPNERGSYLYDVIEKFADRFCDCNPTLGMTQDTVFVLCFSLIMLSVDLCSPHIKNKMSKREFIRNTRRAAQVTDDLAGHLYDNIYLIGHVAVEV